jgi:hypothetical protein
MARSDIYKRGEITTEQLGREDSGEEVDIAGPLDEGLEGENYYEEGEETFENEGVEAETFDSNLADYMDDEELRELGSDLIEQYEEDLESRSDWEDIVRDGIDLLGFKIESLDEPFPGACGVSHPLLAQSVVKFQAKAFKELFPAGGPAKAKLMGTPSPEKEAQAKRVTDYLNYQTTIDMPEYGPETDRMLFYVGMFGSGFKKSWYDGTLGRITNEFVKGEDFVIDYYATSLESAERYTHRMLVSGNKILQRQLNGQYIHEDLDSGGVSEDSIKELEDELSGQSEPGINRDDIYTLLEMHVNLDLTGYEHEEGLMLPYIVTVVLETGQVLAIRRNWDEGDENYRKKVWFVHYSMIPGLGLYGYGYIHLIGGLSKTATSTLRQLIDAGTFATLPAGFKAHGLRVLAPDEPLQPGEWREVNAPAGDLNKSLIPLPYREPSSTLMSLMTFVVDAGREFADASDKIVSEASNYGPVGTTMALLENSTKLYSAIHKRLHAAQAQELKLLARLNSEYLPDQYPYNTTAGENQIFKADFDLTTIDVIPVSDPNMPTEVHRIARINAIMGIAQQDPSAHNMNAIRQDLYAAMGVENPERYLAQSQQPFTGDPVSENAMAMRSAPLAAKDTQNHDAHIKVHSSILENPAYANAPGMRSVMIAHVQEHLAMKYRMEMIQMIGDPNLIQAVMSGQPLPPEMEQQIAVAAANVSDSLLNLDIAKEQALAGQSTDPLIAMQERQMALDEAKQTQKSMVDSEKLRLQEMEILIDDENTDLDRAARLTGEEIRASSFVEGNKQRNK